MVFSFLPLFCALYFKKCSFVFLKNVLLSKRVICFILNNLHFPMVKDIAFYALYESRVLIVPCKVNEFCLFTELADEIYKMASGSVIKFRI